MANRWHCVGVGSFDSASWAGEIAQVGISGVGSAGVALSTGHINTSLIEFSAVADGTNATTTHCTVNYGSIGQDVWTAANQNTIAEAMWAFLNASKASQASTFSWKEIRLSAFTSDGKVVNGASVYTITAPLVGGGSIAFPPQTAVVTSLVTGGRGPRNRGRIYLPFHVGTLGTGALVPAGSVSGGNTNTKTLVNAVNAMDNLQCAVVSPTHQTFSDVTAVRTGDELDTQRRRRGGRKEVYTTLAI